MKENESKQNNIQRKKRLEGLQTYERNNQYMKSKEF